MAQNEATPPRKDATGRRAIGSPEGSSDWAGEAISNRGTPRRLSGGPRGDNQGAIDFLHRWRPEGPWILTAIATDKKSITTATFRDPDTCLAWIERHNGTRNIYFHVNPCTRDLKSKASREDVAALAWLHVDIDPRAGEDLQEERDRALSMLRDPPGGVPRPTVIVFSGGGYQGFWKLAEPLPIDGDLDRAEDAKLYNLQLEVIFGADNCHNVDRIMRLPGTMNIPDARKKKKGRTTEQARLIEFHDDRVYPLGQFNKARPVQTDDPGQSRTFSPSATTVEISGNVARLNDIEELNEWDVPDRVKVICVQGRDPDSPKEGDDSRSAWLFDAVCQLVRKGVPDEVIYSVITDPDFGISESVLDKGSNVDKYAKKQIESAKAHSACPELAEINSKFFVVEEEGSKCRVASFRTALLERGVEREHLVLQSFADFRNRFMHRQIQVDTDSNGNAKYKPLGEWWLRHPKRRQYRQIEFLPGQDAPPGVFNLWRGFSVNPSRGSWSLMGRHIWEVLAGRDRDAFRYIIKWAAWAVQNPGRCAEVALVFRGGKGTGKGTFARWLTSLFGQHGLQIFSSKHLVGEFNAHLRDCVLLFADEAVTPRDRKAEGTLKGYLTEPMLPIERKGFDVVQAPNHLHVVMASNEDWVVPAGPDERRFAVFDVSDAHRQEAKWFAPLNHQMRLGGDAGMLADLLRVPLGAWHPREDVPQNASLMEQKVRSMTAEQKWWYEILRAGQIAEVPWVTPMKIPTEKIQKLYCDACSQANVRERSWQTELGQLLKRLCPPLQNKLARLERRQVRVYCLPALEEARACWERHFGPTEWPQDEEVACDDDLAIAGLFEGHEPF